MECRCGEEAIWRERIKDRQRRDLAPHHTTTWALVSRCQIAAALPAH